MLSLMIILLAAAVGHGLARWRGLPVIPLMLAMGLLLNGTGVLGSAAGLQDTLLLGLTFLLFVVGAELDPTPLGRWRRPAILLAVVQFAFIGGLGFLAARMLAFSPRSAAYIGLAIASSSTLVVVAMLRRREQVFEDTGRLAIGVVMVQDLLVILALPLVMAETPAEMGRGSAATVLLLGLAVLIGRVVMPRVIPRLEFDEEPLLLLVLATLFGFVGLAHVLGVPPVIGAFLAGLSVSRFPVNAIVRGPVGSLADFFLALFFIALGATVEFHDPRQLVLDALLLAGMLVLAPLLLVPIARRVGLTMRSSIEVAGLLAQCGELAVAVMLIGMARGHVDASAFGTVTLVVVATLLLAPALSSDAASWRLMRRLHVPRRGAEAPVPATAAATGHVLFLGCGTSTQRLIRHLRAAGQPVLAVDDDEAVVERLAAEGVPIIRGDGADPHLLRRLGLRSAQVIVSTMRRRTDQERLLRLAGSTPVIVRTFEPSTARQLEGCGATVVSESEEAARAFFTWFEAAADADADAAAAAADHPGRHQPGGNSRIEG